MECLSIYQGKEEEKKKKKSCIKIYETLSTLDTQSGGKKFGVIKTNTTKKKSKLECLYVRELFDFLERSITVPREKISVLLNVNLLQGSL